MKARQMIMDGGFDPEDVVYLTKILDEVWDAEKSRKFLSGEDAAIKRERIASLIMALARTSLGDDPEVFKARIIQQFGNGGPW